MRRHLLVTNDFPPKHGGIQTLLWELWRRLPSDEFAVLTTPHDGAAAFDAQQPFRIERTRQPVLLPTPMLRHRIERLASEIDADLVVLDPVLPVGGLGPTLSRPYGVFMHGSELIGRLPVGDLVSGRILRRADLVIAAGSYPAGETARLARGKVPPVAVVPCGVDSSRFVPLAPGEKLAARRELGLPEDGALVVGVSRLVRRKGFDVLIESIARLDGVHLAIGGTGRDRSRLARMAHERVHLVGRVPDDRLARFYGCGDAFAMLCRDQWGGLEKEGFGIVFLEAAACGIPQVAGRSGGSADAVDDGVTGVVVDDPRDVRAVAAAVARVLDPAVNAAMGAAARRRAVEVFDYDVLAAALKAALS